MTARAVILATSALLVVTLARAEAPLSRANPASTNCVNHGGTLLMETDGSGGQYGVCRFADDRQCEEWALLRGECPPGGIRVTGYVTPAARYCALRGAHYQVLAGSNTPNEQGSCQFPGGRTCAADAFFSGLCTPDGADGIFGQCAHAAVRISQGPPQGGVAFVVADQAQPQRSRPTNCARSGNQQAFQGAGRISPLDAPHESSHVLAIEVL